MTDTETKTGGEALVDALLANGIDTIFGLPGVQLDPFFAALFDSQDRLRVINARHEQGVAYMAYGYAQSTGKTGVYSVVPGPGMLNTTAALSTAYSCNTPVLLVTGQIPSALIGAKRGQLHELPDQLGILERLTKKALRMGHPAEAGETLNTLLREMWSGRPGPVAIEAAPDILAITAPTRTTVAAEMPVAPPFDADKVAQAARILGQAERPMILVGGGAFHASEEITALARMLSAPVQSWMLGRGVVDDRTGLSVNRPAAGQWWRETDAVLCIGSRGEYERATWGLDRDMAFIHVDIDPEELTRAWTPDIGILGDARDVAAALLEAIPAENRKRPGRIEEIAALRDRTRAYLDEKLGPQMAWLDAMRRALPEDGFFVEEFTQVGYVSRIGFPAYFPRSIVTPGYQGTLGYGYATALGVQVAHPDKCVLSVSGDGGFLFTANEIATAVHYNLPLVSVVFADGAYGNVQRIQRDLYGNRILATNFTNPDFVKYAESFGADGRRARTPEELGVSLTEAFKARRPTVIEVPVGQFPDPWPIFMAKPPKGQGRKAMPDYGAEAANPFE
jgi:acetolactate synthase-1/2/3 large subunit